MALFVDAGYLLAGAHDLLGNTTTRSAFDCNYEELLPKLKGWVEENSGASLLRTYWYDGARDGLPTADHRKIGDQPYVKVRLGRLNKRGQQKGVDGLIYRDLDMYVQLIVAAEKRVGDLKPYPDTKPSLRKAFWTAFAESTAPSRRFDKTVETVLVETETNHPAK